jgi:hypothetical protein
MPRRWSFDPGAAATLPWATSCQSSAKNATAVEAPPKINRHREKPTQQTPGSLTRLPVRFAAR